MIKPLGINRWYYACCTNLELEAREHSFDGRCGTKKIDKPTRPCAIKKAPVRDDKVWE